LQNSEKFDTVIIGSGIAGSMLAAILAKQRFKVLVIESGTHPKFAIGESLIIETSEVLRSLSELFEVPEIAHFSSENFYAYIGGSHGVKRHFSYLYHDEQGKQNPDQVLQAVIPKEPYGHELHLFRQDSDAYMLSVAVNYGATVLQNTRIDDVAIDSAGVSLSIAGGEEYMADYIVDSGGFKSFLAEKFNLRTSELNTYSRTIFTHMVGVPSYHSSGPDKAQFGIPYSLAEGTLHHLFKGGWLWVIPFNNHEKSTNALCSVGLLLDPRIHPEKSDLNPEEEFRNFVLKYPQIEKQFKGAKAVRNWVRTGRIQYSSTRVVGDRFALMGHAAGFIDPLFSKGLYASFSCLGILVHTLIEAKQEQNYSAQRFNAVQEKTLKMIRSNDLLVKHAFQSFSHYSLWQQYSVLWLLGAYLEGLKLTCTKIQLKKQNNYQRRAYFEKTAILDLVGGGYPEFFELSQKVQKIISRASSEGPDFANEAAEKIKAMYFEKSWIPFVFKDIARGMNHLPVKKFRFRLFKKNGGMMASGHYKKYFFDEINWMDIGRFILSEKKVYGVRALVKSHQSFLRAQNHL